MDKLTRDEMYETLSEIRERVTHLQHVALTDPPLNSTPEEARLKSQQFARERQALTQVIELMDAVRH